MLLRSTAFFGRPLLRASKKVRSQIRLRFSAATVIHITKFQKIEIITSSLESCVKGCKKSILGMQVRTQQDNCRFFLWNFFLSNRFFLLPISRSRSRSQRRAQAPKKLGCRRLRRRLFDYKGTVTSTLGTSRPHSPLPNREHTDIQISPTVHNFT